jgi:YD repeat-containing protein
MSSRHLLKSRDLVAIVLVILLFVIVPRLIVSVWSSSASHPGADGTALVARGPVYFVHLGEPMAIDLEALREYYQQTLGLKVTILPPLPLDPGDFDSERRQFVAERVIASMRQRLSKVAQDRTASVIGILEQDMYIASANWRYAFSWRADGRFAVVSSARMMSSNGTGETDTTLLTSRVRKMLTKSIGLLVYRLPLSDDPTSVLYRNVGGVEELDVMQDRFEGAGPDAAPTMSAADVSYPCFVISPLEEWDGQTRLEPRIDRCVPGLRTERQFDELEVDLRSGVLVTRHSDFFRPDSMPLVLTRAYHSWDDVSRAFGVGGNHPYDILPVGSRTPYTFIDILMPDGGAIHYDRISKGFGYANAVFEHHGRTAFFGSRFSWNGDGWDLRFPDGGLFLFPENYSGTRNNQGAPSRMDDGAGHRIVFQRDRDRRLLRLLSPSGVSLKFDYDDGYRVRNVTDDEGRVVRYEYDANGRLTLVTDGARRTRYAYDDTVLSSIASDGTGRLVEFAYYRKRVAAIAFANGQRFDFAPAFGEGPDRPATAVDIVDDAGTKTAVQVR